MTHPLDGPWLKAGRARYHFECLDEAVDEFVSTKPYRTYIEVNPEQAKKILWIEVADPPPGLSLILGDCIHNLRSALDQFVWQCGLLKGEPGFNSQFPVFLDEDEFVHGRKFPNGRRGRSGRTMLSAVKVPEAVALIERVQPYNKAASVRTRTGLWLINTLSNIDKHRLLPVMLLYARAMGGSGKGEIAVNFGPYKGKAVLATSALDVPDEDLQVDVGLGATVTVLPGDGIPGIPEGILTALELRCLPAVEAVLRESVELDIFPPR